MRSQPSTGYGRAKLTPMGAGGEGRAGSRAHPRRDSPLHPPRPGDQLRLRPADPVPVGTLTRRRCQAARCRYSARDLSAIPCDLPGVLRPALEVGILDQADDVSEGIEHARHADPTPHVLHSALLAGAEAAHARQRGFAVLDSPIGHGAPRARLRFAQVRVQAELVATHIEAYVERLVEIGIDSERLPVPLLGRLKVFDRVDDRAETKKRGLLHAPSSLETCRVRESSVRVDPSTGGNSIIEHRRRIGFHPAGAPGTPARRRTPPYGLPPCTRPGRHRTHGTRRWDDRLPSVPRDRWETII